MVSKVFKESLCSLKHRLRNTDQNIFIIIIFIQIKCFCSSWKQLFCNCRVVVVLLLMCGCCWCCFVVVVHILQNNHFAKFRTKIVDAFCSISFLSISWDLHPQVQKQHFQRQIDLNYKTHVISNIKSNFKLINFC